MKFSWFIFGDGPLRKGTLIIGAIRWIGGGLNANAPCTNVGAFTTSTWGETCG